MDYINKNCLIVHTSAHLMSSNCCVFLDQFALQDREKPKTLETAAQTALLTVKITLHIISYIYDLHASCYT